MLSERLGRYSAAGQLPHKTRPIWLHCASVGEVRTAAPLISTIQKRRPDIPLLITTATATGAETARTKLPEGVLHAYQPIDWPGAIRRFLRVYQPRMAVVLETEIWPNLFFTTKRFGIPLLLANARLSSRSMDVPAMVQRLQSATLARVDVVLARSTEEAKRFSKLGVDPAHIRALGSLKLAHSDDSAIEPFPLGRKAILAASTHDDEEQRIASAWAAAAREEQLVPRLLIVAPRHPERGPRIRDTLHRSGFRVALRSADENWQDADIYIADTIGELESFMAASEVVIIGGSLVDRGGQNLVEPARLGLPILFGPHMYNFAEESDRLRATGGAQRFINETDLQQAIIELFRDEQGRKQLGTNAAATVSAAQDIASLYADAVLEHVR
ncbi:3-deoxy-D-manno-octulosonic acid transferase [Halorhodospira halochloris]|uniref:3-deoxy-D-manno-octulosonic acid transferase n=1 Tax=Halorhodospira halochloris TaxID=1052 RepID=A0A110B6U0_HALHR|nr:glycosyltransferase N-terminal domain-containing protein [Halorhodospira halochloris]MCG5529803.1 3-deoxy-D-manno-octulosonic acid transferase [Halorhodospira halochloris]BAU56818.2 lipid IVA 3-deoxy-D-manno-octulosonic acid transferase [Halorhodospira halochloris]